MALSRQGIGYQGKAEVPFSLAEIKFNGLRLRVKQKGNWLDAFGAPARKIPNVFILLEMAGELQGGAASPPSSPFLRT